MRSEGARMAEQNILLPIITGAAGILGAGVTGLVNYRVQTATAKRQRRNERASLAIAFATEIRAHIESVGIRRQTEVVAEYLERLKNGSLRGHAGRTASVSSSSAARRGCRSGCRGPTPTRGSGATAGSWSWRAPVGRRGSPS